jgi:hypothetical protein
VNRLFGTDVKMPFRVNKYGPKHHRAKLGEEIDEAANHESWKLVSRELLDRIQARQTPAYSSFYNEAIRRKVRDIYTADFDYLLQCLNRGIIDPEFHSELASI